MKSKGLDNMDVNTCYILLGTNLGDRVQNIRTANQYICERIGGLKVTSAIYETEPWGERDQGDFLNQALMVDTELTAEHLLAGCLSIESDMGRVRHEKWRERLIDIDLLYFNTEAFSSDRLTVPHPQLHRRRFALVPLAEMSPDYVHPVLGVSNEELLRRCTDPLRVAVHELKAMHGKA